MSTLNGLNGQLKRLEQAAPVPVSPLDDLRVLFTYIPDEDLEKIRHEPKDSPVALEILARARKRYKDGLPPFSYNGFAFPEGTHGNTE